MANRIKALLSGVRNQLAQITGQTVDVPDDGRLLDETVLTSEKGEYRLKLFGENEYALSFVGEPLEAGGRSPVAIKRIRSQWGRNKAIKEHFKQEINIVRDFLHPRLPRYEFQGELGGIPYYAYSYVEGVPLTQILDKKEYYPPELVREIAPDLVAQLLQQLRYLHERMDCVVHGNIGLRSLLLSPDHQLSLIEFACAYRKDRVINQDYGWLIDPRYCSPEQARQEAWDERSDIYQAGVVFYELLTGRAWNAEKTPEEQARYAAELQVSAADFLSEYASISVSTLVADMLHPDAALRPQSASVCLERLSH